MQDTENLLLMGTVEERFWKWHNEAVELAKKYNIIIEFTTQSRGSRYNSFDVPVVEVSGGPPNYRYWEHEGVTYINE
jgi:hypothetical protein